MISFNYYNGYWITYLTHKIVRITHIMVIDKYLLTIVWVITGNILGYTDKFLYTLFFTLYKCL